MTNRVTCTGLEVRPSDSREDMSGLLHFLYNSRKETSMTGHTETDSSPYPLPTGEGQTDTPINRHNQGEVLTARIEKSVFIGN